MPGTVQATIGARIDRLDPPAKRTLNAAAVIGLRFRPELLTRLGVEPALDELVRGGADRQVRFTPRAEYAFHHPLIRAVAYESQLKSDRSEWHRRLAAVIQTSEPESVDENAALDRRAPGGRRRGARSISLAHARGALVDEARYLRSAGQLGTCPPDRRRVCLTMNPDLTAMRIAPRTKLCGSAWRGVQRGRSKACPGAARAVYTRG